MTHLPAQVRLNSEGCPLRNYRFGHDIFWAGFVGFLLGILFSFTIWAGNRVIQTKALLIDDFETIFPIRQFNLNLSEPTEATTVSQPVITISGTTSGEATVLISGGASDLVIDSTGRFTTSYTLLEGENELTISAIGANGEQATTTRNIFYTTESLQ